MLVGSGEGEGKGEAWLDSLGSHVFATFGIGGEAAYPDARGGAVVPSLAPNPDHEREKAVEAQKEKKRRGVEDWKLGDGAAELQSAKPWCEAMASPLPAPSLTRAPAQCTMHAPRKHRLLRDCHGVCVCVCGGGGCGGGRGESHTMYPLDCFPAFQACA